MTRMSNWWIGAAGVVLMTVMGSTWAGPQVRDRWDGERWTTRERATAKPGDDCDDPAADHGKQMKCKHQKLADAVCETSDLAADPEIGGVFTQNQKDRFARSCDKSQNWVNASGREEDFRQAFHKRGADCYVEEILDDGIGDDDGICSKGEQHKEGCVEDVDDGIGNNDGICEELTKGKGKKTWEACSVICDVDGDESGGDVDLVDAERAEMLGSAVDDAAASLGDLNEQLENKAASLQAQRGALTALGTLYDPDQCLGLLLYEVTADFPTTLPPEPIHYDNEERPFTYEGLNKYRQAAHYAMAGEACDDAFAYSWSFGIGGESGGSTQAWCIIPHIADAIVQDIAEGMELLDDAITGTRIDNTARCLQTVGAMVKGIDEGVKEANVKLDEVIRLLNLAHGQRPGWPGCDNDGSCDNHEDPITCPADCGTSP